MVRRTSRIAVALLVLAAAFAAAAWTGTKRAASPGAQPASILAAPTPVSADGRDSLDTLRTDSLYGDAQASVLLVGRLLDRFDRTGERDDLHEAFHLMARDWDQGELMHTDLVHRALHRHCGDRLLRWHWLCVSGE